MGQQHRKETKRRRRAAYIKRTPLTEFRAQGRGGIGIKGSDTKDEDFIEHI